MQPDVFLSSCFIRFMDVRQKIRALDVDRIWTIEDQREDLDTRKGVPHFAIVDTLVDQIMKSRVFVCVLRDWYGSSVFENAESVSFLETEIYQAAVFHTDVHFFLMEPFDPNPRLKGLLDLISAIRPGIIPKKILSEEKVLEGIKKILDQTKHQKQAHRRVPVRGLVGELALMRGYPKSDIEFFNKVFRAVSSEPKPKPDKDHIHFLMDDLSNEKDRQKRLTRMWIALRELSSAPYDQSEFAEYLPLWNDALGAWKSEAGWYGLHGHLFAGSLASINSLLKIRERMDLKAQGRSAPGFIQRVKGGRASAYYSMAKLMPTKHQREQYLNLALSDVQDALNCVSDDQSGLFAVRGHIFEQQGQLTDSLKDFYEMKRLREERRDEGGIGEALADLGLIQMRLGNLDRAHSLLQEGAEKLERTGRHEFAIRAKKRLALVHLRSLRPRDALNELCLAYDDAQEWQVYGQITPLMETIHDFASRLGLWGRR